MILTKEMAKRAKTLIEESRAEGIMRARGVCWAIKIASMGEINLDNKPESFWGDHKENYEGYIYRFPMTLKGDKQRRAFIDSLIGKDL